MNLKWPLKTKNNFFCENKNIQINILETKVKIRYIYRDEKLI